MIGKKRNYNETHPELEEGEMFLTNSVDENYTRIRWNTKRRGMQAYTIDGELLTGFIPVFVQKKEYEEGMKKYREERI
jgi:hypothetical protein